MRATENLRDISHFGNSRDFFDRIGFERILRFHLVRFIGIYFLYLYYQGKLPYEFAVLGGVGDIIVAIFALILLFYTQSRNFKQVVFVWNTVGLIDILFVISTAIRFLIEDRSQMEQLTHLPLSLLPTFVVPLIISSHYITFYLLNSQKRARQAH